MFSFSSLMTWGRAHVTEKMSQQLRESQTFLFPILASSPARDPLQRPIFHRDLGCWFLFCKLNCQEGGGRRGDCTIPMKIANANTMKTNYWWSSESPFTLSSGKVTNHRSWDLTVICRSEATTMMVAMFGSSRGCRRWGRGREGKREKVVFFNFLNGKSVIYS